MDIQTEKLDLIEWISKLEDASVINELMKIKEDYSNSKDWADSLKQEELASIKRGLNDFDNKNVHSHQTARRIYEKYL